MVANWREKTVRSFDLMRPPIVIWPHPCLTSLRSSTVRPRLRRAAADGGLALTLDLTCGLRAARVERLVREVRHCLSHAPLAAGGPARLSTTGVATLSLSARPAIPAAPSQRPAAAAVGVPSSRSNSAGVLERFLASSLVMMPRRTRSASAASMVCMPNAVPVCMVE